MCVQIFRSVSFFVVVQKAPYRHRRSILSRYKIPQSELCASVSVSLCPFVHTKKMVACLCVCVYGRGARASEYRANPDFIAELTRHLTWRITKL